MATALQPREEQATGRAEALRVGILGATGYVGAELVRILERHPGVRIVGLAARNREGMPVGEAFAHLEGTGHTIEAALPEPGAIDAAFIALPHGQAATLAPQLLESGVLVVDLGPDFRLADPADYPTWYDFEHPAAGLLPGGTGGSANGSAVYGLPELHRDELRRARLVASPGCYPTAALLALAPLARAGLIGDLVVDAKSGVSGAGREPKLETHFGELNESVKAYGLGGHRHLAEIRQELRVLGVQEAVLDGLVFTPHLVPMTRGLLATCYVRPTRSIDQAELDRLYRDAYELEPCVDVASAAPPTKSVTGSNLCRVFVRLDERSGRIVALGAIDNLVKGAAGQAVQAFNICAGLDETAGLEQLPLYP
ncbi:MAG TPA: N-acetyl-gamma-glutamyl-phosphate reductase [Candidatus Limnocylindrales bacterium]|nr:N-acetyl-gamma-glutamyl-phosphate reductase [Candidatus Limnocylindrales bacterium]